MSDSETADTGEMVIDAGKGRGVVYAVLDDASPLSVKYEGYVTPRDLTAVADALLTKAAEKLSPTCRCVACRAVRAARDALAPVRSQPAASGRPH